MILQANSPEVAVHVLSVNNCCDDFFAEVKTEVTVLFKKDVFFSMHILTNTEVNTEVTVLFKNPILF